MKRLSNESTVSHFANGSFSVFTRDSHKGILRVLKAHQMYCRKLSSHLHSTYKCPKGKTGILEDKLGEICVSNKSLSSRLNVIAK